ncbi:hypothetical protein HK101_008781 [Irineochytrium annulatum]|nr:hypothetical protein HK101_008781 [Irineochytrium annulatum]
MQLFITLALVTAVVQAYVAPNPDDYYVSVVRKDNSTSNSTMTINSPTFDPNYPPHTLADCTYPGELLCEVQCGRIMFTCTGVGSGTAKNVSHPYAVCSKDSPDFQLAGGDCQGGVVVYGVTTTSTTTKQMPTLTKESPAASNVQAKNAEIPASDLGSKKSAASRDDTTVLAFIVTGAAAMLALVV